MLIFIAIAAIWNCCPTAAIALSLGALYVLVRKLCASPRVAPKPASRKLDFEQDTVYLYQFARVRNVACTSPFCLKIEVLCRAHRIPYEIIVQRGARSRNGTLPFVELNGEHIADSDLIEHRLREHFNIPDLPEDQEARATALARLADNHLFHVLTRFKIDSDEFWETIVIPGIVPSLFRRVLRFILKVFITRKLYNRSKAAIGDFEWSELKELLSRDLNAIRRQLGEQKFLFGDKISPVDATVFAHLAAVYYRTRCHVSDVLETDFPTILEYMERMRQEIFPNDFKL